jgi:hypothetical protein
VLKSRTAQGYLASQLDQPLGNQLALIFPNSSAVE